MNNDTDFFGQFDGEDLFQRSGGLARGRGFGPRMGHGNVTPNVLKALEEKPMYGYEIIQHFERKSLGLWRPSPGSVYPVLQALEEQGLVRSQEMGGKKVYEITDAGKNELKKFPWGQRGHGMEHHFKRRQQLVSVFKGTFQELMRSLRRIAADGSDQDLQSMKRIIDEAAAELSQLAGTINEKK